MKSNLELARLDIVPPRIPARREPAALWNCNHFRLSSARRPPIRWRHADDAPIIFVQPRRPRDRKHHRKHIPDMTQVDFQSMPAPVAAPEPACMPIGQLLVMRGFISPADLERGLEFQAQFGGRLGAVLVRIGALAESNLLVALSEQLGLPILPGGDMPTDASGMLATIALSGLAPEWWLDQEALVWENLADGTIYCVARDPLLPSLNEAVEFALGRHHQLRWWLTLNQDLDRALDLVEQALRHERHR